MTDTPYTAVESALVLPIEQAIAQYQPQGFMSAHLGGLRGQVRVFEKAAHFVSLDLDAAFFDDTFVGALFCQGLIVDTWLVQANGDHGPFIHVQGDVRARNILLGGGYVHVAGDVTVEQTLLAGFYNHGYTVFGGRVSAPLVMTFDHGIMLDTTLMNAGVFLSDEARQGVAWHEPAQVLPAAIWQDDALNEHAVLKAMKAGKPVIKAAPVSALQRRLDKARASTVGKADLSRLKLETVPLAVADLPGLQTLDLSGNPLTEVGEHLASCTQLKTVSLSNCGLSAVPEVLARMPQLVQIDLSHNRIGTLPAWWQTLVDLRSLDLSGCAFTSVPDVLAELPGLEHLALHDQDDESALRIERGFSTLQSLLFRGQLLSALPELESLDWGAYSSRAVPPTVLGSTRLKRLDLRRAPRLDGLPDALAQLTQLKEIGLSLHDDFDNIAVLAELPRLQSVAVCYRDEFIPHPFHALMDMPHWTALEVQGWLDDRSILTRLLARPNLKRFALRDPDGKLHPVDIARERRRLGIV